MRSSFLDELEKNPINFLSFQRTKPNFNNEQYKNMHDFLASHFDHPHLRSDFDEREKTMFFSVVQGTNSALNHIPDSSLKYATFSGIQWKLLYFYVVFYSALDASIQSPSISAFIIYLFDIIIEIVFHRFVKCYLSVNTFIDSRFLL